MGKAEDIIRKSGCGPFQIKMVLMTLILGDLSCAFLLMFMAYGNYNPGWLCLDNNSATFTFNDSSDIRFNYSFAHGNNNIIIHHNDTWLNRNTESLMDAAENASCHQFHACANVQFDTETSTIVSEWGLLCHQSWVPRLVISLQMVGQLCGNLVSGYLLDTFGRKKILYASYAFSGCVCLIAVFSQSWQMFTVIRFCCGIGVSLLIPSKYVLPIEQTNVEYRSYIAAIPSFNVSAVIFGLIALACKSWKILHLVNAAICFLSCISALWVPESLRWLEVKKKHKEFRRVTNKITANNNISLEPLEMDIHETRSMCSNKDDPEPIKKYSTLDLFRKGYRRHSLIFGFCWMSMSLIYYAISFGIKAMHGDFYVNFILLFVVDIPFCFIQIKAPNLLGRRLASIVFFGCATVSLFATMSLELWASGNFKSIGMFVFPWLAKFTVDSAWYTQVTYALEIYPTVVRGTGFTYLCIMARLGGITAPFLIPDDADGIFICYAIMGGMCLVCCFLVMLLPETRGKPLKETFDDGDDDDDDGDDDDDDHGGGGGSAVLSGGSDEDEIKEKNGNASHKFINT